MTEAEIDAALVQMTDAQINAAFVRRAQARLQIKKDQSAARSAKHRHASRHANSNDSVTQEKRDAPSERHANSSDCVTQTVTQNQRDETSPPNPPSPLPFPTPLPFPAPSRTPSPVLPHEEPATAKKLPDGSRRSRPESLLQVVARCAELSLPGTDAEAIWCKWEGNGFTNDRKPMKNWHSVIRSWQLHGYLPSQKKNGNGFNGNGHSPGKPKRCL